MPSLAISALYLALAFVIASAFFSSALFGGLPRRFFAGGSSLVVVARDCLVGGKGGGAMFVRSAVSAGLVSLISVKPTSCVGSDVEPPSRRSLSLAHAQDLAQWLLVAHALRLLVGLLLAEDVVDQFQVQMTMDSDGLNLEEGQLLVQSHFHFLSVGL
jgi:hypothetical protein